LISFLKKIIKMLILNKKKPRLVNLNHNYKSTNKIKKNKYNAIKTTVNGVVYDSKKEAKVAILAEHKLKNKEIKAVERQVIFKFPLNCKRPPKMIIDFRITKLDDSYELWEVKGGKATMTPVYKLKKKLLKHFFNLEPIEI